MNRPDLTDIRTLFAVEGPCVSIFLPTHRAGPEIRQDPIRLKNLLREANERLEELGRSPEAAEQFLSDALGLLDHQDFWRHQLDGLAVLVGPGVFETYRIPAELEELVIVGPRFHLLPLLPHLESDRRFHVLALSQNRVRLYEGDDEELRELDPEDIPEELRDVVGYDFEQRSLQFHTATGVPSRGGTQRSSMFHGHGDAKDADLAELQRFVRRVDDGVLRLVGSPPPPMIVAAVERVAVAYRNVSDHPNLVDETVEGNPEAVALPDLHQRSLEALDDEAPDVAAEAIARYRALGPSSERTAASVEEIVPASEAGRVEILLHTPEARCWGRFDEETRQVETRDEPRDDDEDLVDRAEVLCLLQGGRVLRVPAAEIPSDGPLAAVYRY